MMYRQRSSEANRRPHCSCIMLLWASICSPPPLIALNIACFWKGGCMPAYQHFLENFLKSRLLDCFEDMLTVNWLKRCLRVKTLYIRYQHLSTVQLTYVFLPGWLTLIAGFTSPLLYTCTCIIFQFILLSDLILLCGGD